MSRSTAVGETRGVLAGHARRSRQHTEPIPLRASRAPRATPITPDELDLRRRCAVVRQLATDGITPTLRQQVGPSAYDRRRSDSTKNAFYAFVCELVEEVNAGQSEGQTHLYEVELVSIMKDLHPPVSERPGLDIKALEARYECQSQITWADIQRRIASGERESPEMWDTLATAEAMDIAHDIELFRYAQRRARELRKAAQTPAVRLEK